MLDQSLDESRAELELKHRERCFFKSRMHDHDSDDSPDSSSTWAVASYITSLDPDGDTLVNDGSVERRMVEHLHSLLSVL